MDHNWERSLPLYKLDLEEASNILQTIDSKWRALELKEITIGCRNSNYRVKTSLGPYFLRISPPEDKNYINESAAACMLNPAIHIPALYHVVRLANRTCMIYEYIDGTSMQSLCTASAGIEDDILRQVARTAAKIHGFNRADAAGFKKLDLPPFMTWYDLFLSNERTAGRLGAEVVKRVQKLIGDRGQELQRIDQYQGFIHSDFRPANMLVDKEQRVYVVDWEFAGMGHKLGDIGQFFRYRSCFTEEQLSVFEKEYNQYAMVPLPSDWVELSRLRDLINPLQMIGSTQELPIKYADLKNLILDTLEYFKY